MQVVRDPSTAQLAPRQRALAGLAALVTEAPWTVTGEDLERVRAAGVSGEGVVQAVTIAALFNHLTRIADATGVEPDYTSPLPRLQVDAGRAPIPRPGRAHWPVPRAASGLSLALRPATQGALARWGDYMRTPTEVLPARDRAVLGRATAFHLCDAAGLTAWDDAQPGTEREATLAAFAGMLTLTPWRMSEAALAPLRQLGFADRDLLHAICVVGFQNVESRLRLVLGPYASDNRGA